VSDTQAIHADECVPETGSGLVDGVGMEELEAGRLDTVRRSAERLVQDTSVVTAVQPAKDLASGAHVRVRIEE
jgi:hypothetical protein